MITDTPPDWFLAALEALRRGDVDEFVGMYDDDAVHEVPLAPHGRPTELVGRAAIRRYVSLLPQIARFESFQHFRVHDVGDEVVVEFTGHATRIGTGEELHLAYIWFIEHDRGRVSHIRDYTIPR